MVYGYSLAKVQMPFNDRLPHRFILHFRFFICRNNLFHIRSSASFPPLFLGSRFFICYSLNRLFFKAIYLLSSSSSNPLSGTKGKRHLPAFLLAICASCFQCSGLHEEFSADFQFALVLLYSSLFVLPLC